jgi:hypothetical protein
MKNLLFLPIDGGYASFFAVGGNTVRTKAIGHIEGAIITQLEQIVD